MRVSFVGYRDWGERLTPQTPRLVVHPFVGHAEAEEVGAFIGRQEADGGADQAEDLLSAMEAVVQSNVVIQQFEQNNAHRLQLVSDGAPMWLNAYTPDANLPGSCEGFCGLGLRTTGARPWS